MKGKAMAGGAVGLVLLGAYFLSNLFNGFGLGPGSGLGTGGQNTDPSQVLNTTEDAETEPVSKVEPPGVELGKMVIVLIDGEDYKVLRKPDADFYDVRNYRPASLERIVEMAKSVEGVDGIKVRIGMRENSTDQAETELRNALLEAGLPRSSFYELNKTIP